MEFKHIRNISTDGVANIYLFDEIGRSMDPRTGYCCGIDGNDFAHEMEYLAQNENVSQINVRINSPGGDVIDGFSIFSAIKNCTKPVDTYIDGLGASIAGIIFQAGQRRFISDFGRLMIHEPSTQTPIELMSDKQRNALNSFRDQLLTILEKNSKLTKDQISTIMKSETWFSANEAIDKGFADEIVNTGRTIDLSPTEAFASNEQILRVANSIHLDLININDKKSHKMELIKNHFGLDATADEQTIVNKVVAIESELTNVKNQIQEKETAIENLTAENDALKAEKTELNDKIAVDAVENAIKNGMIDESKKDEMISIAKVNIENFTTVLSAIKRTPAKVTNTINKPNNGGSTELSLRDLEKTNPKEVERLMNHEPEVYAQMYAKQYGVEPSI